MSYTIYHNNRCRKSREALEVLTKSGKEFKIIEYLKTPPTVDELRDLLKKLNASPEQIIRKGETLFKERFKNKNLTKDQWIEVLSENPSLIERPIIYNDEKATVGRPIENVINFIEP